MIDAGRRGDSKYSSAARHRVNRRGIRMPPSTEDTLRKVYQQAMSSSYRAYHGNKVYVTRCFARSSRWQAIGFLLGDLTQPTLAKLNRKSQTRAQSKKIAQKRSISFFNEPLASVS